MFKKEIIAAVTLAATHAIKIEEGWSNGNSAGHHYGDETLDNAVTVSSATDDTDPGTGLAQTQFTSFLSRLACNTAGTC